MGRSSNIEGGVFREYTQEELSPRYETVPKSSYSSRDAYVAELMQASGLSGNRHRKRLRQYYDENEDLIDPKQKGLRKSQLTTIVESISNQQKSNVGISEEYYDSTQVSSGDKAVDRIFRDTIENPKNPEEKKDVPTDEVDTIITTETPELSPEQQARVYKYQYQTRPANKNDYYRGYNLPEWLNIEVDSEEHNKLKAAIKELGLMPKLGELDAIIKAQHKSNDFSGAHLDFINATRELYGLNPLQTTSEAEYTQDSLPDDSGVEPTPVVSEAQSQYYIVEDSRFNLARYNGNDEMRLSMIRDDLLELGISDIELDELISSRGFPDIPSKPIKIGDKIVDWDDEDPESRFSYRALAIAEYYGIDTNRDIATDQTQATVDENRQEPITNNNMNNEGLPNFGVETQSNESGSLPDENRQEELTREDRSSADGGGIVPDTEAELATTEPELLAIDNSIEQIPPGASPDNTKGEVVANEATPTEEPAPEIPVEGGEADTVTGGESEVNQGTSQLEAEDTEPTNPDLDKLKSELSRLVTESANKLEIEKGQENNQEYSSRLDREKIDICTKNARQAIQSYQEFANEHSSPFNNSNTQIQERYRQLEKIAWYALYKLAHALDGEIATLPTDRDIQLSHPGGVDTKQYLEARGYKFDENGDITHITDNGVEIELNRAMKTESLIKSKRPSRVLYPNPLTSSAISNDIQDGFDVGINIIKDNKQIPTRDWNRPITNNVDLDRYSNRDKPNYYHSYLTKGYLINGLNKHTPDFITAILNEDIIGEVIVDETKQVSEDLEGKASDNVVEELEPTVDVELESNNQSEGGETTPQVSLDDLRLAYARAEEAWNRDTKNRDDLENEFDKAREAYNTELERVLKLQVAQGQEANIHELFKNEVISLRDERITQSQELQGTWEKRLNPLKEKFVDFVIKHKKLMGRVNLGLGIVGGALALTGVGIPLAGGLAVTRRAISGVLLGVSSGEGVRSLGEDADIDINLAWGKIKFQAVIPKLVQESLSANDSEMKQVNDNVLKDRLGTLEAYYRLNGGKFTNDDQQKAYEKILIELGHRVRVNTLEYYQNTQESSSEQTQDISTNQDGLQESVDTSSQDNNSTELVNSSNTETFNFAESRYTSELLNTISDKRVNELDKFRRKRKIATGTGILVGLVAGGAVHALDEINKPDSLDVPESGRVSPDLRDTGESVTPKPTPEPVSPNPSETPGTGGLGEPPLEPKAPPTGAGGDALRESAESTRVAPEQAAQQAAEKLAQDVSSLDSGETISGEVAKQLKGATEAQIQQAVENYLQSEIGQNSIYELAQGTEGGRALLAQWGIDNATEMAGLSKAQLYEISRYLAPGELQGITELSLDNLTPFEVVEPPQADVLEAIAPKPSTEPPTPSVEPTPSAAPVGTPAPEVQPIASTEFTRGLSEALGTTNLTETQLQEAIYSFATSEQGSVALYNQIISNTEGARFLSGFGVNNPADFANLRPDELYEIAQTVGVENLDKLPGFELNDIILSQFEDAPDSVELLKGSSALTSVNRYIASELGSLPYDSNLGKQVLDTYVQTDLGKQWLYDAIVNNPDINNQNIQYFKEYLRFKDIKSPEEFVSKFDWAEFSGNKKIPTSGFWNQIRLPNGGTRLQPLSTFLQPSKMTGIKDAIHQVLTK